MSHVVDHPLPIHTWAGEHSNYVKRMRFLKDHNLPRIDEINLNVGASLANIFFSTANHQLRKELGVEPLLEGPTGQMMMEPKNVMKGKRVLTELYPRYKVQVLTHQAILDIGEKLEQKFESAFTQKLEEVVKAKEQEIVQIMTEEMNTAVANKQAEMEELYRIRLKNMRNDIIENFREYMTERDKYICYLSEEKIKESLEVLRASMAEEMELAAARMKSDAVESCIFNRIWDSNKKGEQVKKKISDLKKKWFNMVKEAMVSVELEKKDLIECIEEQHKNQIASLFELFNEECNEKINYETHNLKRTISQLNVELTKLKNDYEGLKKEKECMDVQQYSWCFLVQELLNQFQKFISFALKEQPVLTGYLTSLEKLLKAREFASQEMEVIRGYLKKHGSTFMEEQEADRKLDEERKLLAKVANKARQKGIRSTCMPPDDVIHFKDYYKQLEHENMMKEIEKIIDSLLRLTIPSREGSKPCIGSSIMSSKGDEDAGPFVIPTPSNKDFRVLGENSSVDLCNWTSSEDRIKAVLEILNNHPTLKRILISQ